MTETAREKIDLSTDKQVSDHRRIREALRRQCKLNGTRARAAGTDSGPAFGAETTVGAIAQEVGLTPQLVADHLEDAWLVVLDKNAGNPVEAWKVSEDGE